MPDAFTVELHLSNWKITSGHELILFAIPYGSQYGGVRYYFRSDNYSTPTFIYQCGEHYSDRTNTNILVSNYTQVTMTIVCSNNYKQLYINGENAYSYNRSLTGSWNSSGIFIGSTGSSQEYLAASYHSGRIYSRMLSSTEIAYNYAIDKKRFELS